MELLEAEEAKKFYAQELIDFGIDKPIFSDSSGSSGGKVVSRKINIWIPENGNKAAIDFLIVQGFVKKRRQKDGYGNGIYNRHGNGLGYLVNMSLDVKI